MGSYISKSNGNNLENHCYENDIERCEEYDEYDECDESSNFNQINKRGSKINEIYVGSNKFKSSQIGKLDDIEMKFSDDTHDVHDVHNTDYTDDMMNEVLLGNPKYVCQNELEILSNFGNHKISHLRSKKSGNVISILQINPENLDLNNVNRVIVYNHGNNENIYTVEPILVWLSKVCSSIVISYDYTYDKIIPSEENCYDCLKTIVDHVVKLHVNKNILLVGYSFGTGVVIDYVNKTRWQMPILLLASYKSIPNNQLLKEDVFDNISKINNVQCPILFVHGKKDVFINWTHTKQLFDATPIKKFNPVYYDNANHNDLFSYLEPKIFNKLFSFNI